jgi:hypothetical protein
MLRRVALRDDPRWPPTRFAPWRLHSRVAAVLDDLSIVLGCVLFVGSLALALATWPSDRVLVSPTDVQRWAAALLIPGWAWLLISGLLFSGFRRENYRRRWGPRLPSAAIAVVVVAALLCVVTIGGGLLIGAAKGSLRVAAHQYEVFSGSLNSGEWTTVSHGMYRRWEARFLRLDSFFSFFALAMVCSAAGYRRLARIDRSMPGDP